MPSFAKDFPSDPELQRLLEAFSRGDYRTVRKGALALESDPRADESVRKAAAVLRGRLDTDPLAKLLLLLTFALLVVLAVYWERHDGRRNLEPDQPARSTAPLAVPSSSAMPRPR